MPGRCVVVKLGEFRVEVDGLPVPEAAWTRTKAAALVKLLALAPRHRLHREHLIEQLWPDLEPAPAGANLRKAVMFARRALGSPDAVSFEGDVLLLSPAGDLVTDAERFEVAVAQALSTQDAGTWATVAALYTGDLLPDDRYEPWAETPRAALRAKYLEALRGAGMWEALAAADPLDERANRALMQAHLDSGERVAAMRQFERIRTALGDELGVAPDRATGPCTSGSWPWRAGSHPPRPSGPRRSWRRGWWP